MQFVLPCFYAFLGSFGYCFHYGIRMRKKMLLFASLGGALGWAGYLLFGLIVSDIPQYFFATVTLALYSEIMARIYKTPATVYLLSGLIPLVPGGGIYYTMEHCINGEVMEFIDTGLHTFGIAGALALGILVVTALMRVFVGIQNFLKNRG